MNTTTRIVRKNFAGDSISHDYAGVTLASVPGVSIDGDRSDTAPMQPAIKSARVPPPTCRDRADSRCNASGGYLPAGFD